MSRAQTVLVVDDDPAFVKATQVLLESAGYRVDSAKSGQEALARMSVAKPDLLLLDVMMDVPLDGVYVTETMLSKPSLWDIPIIMISSIAGTEYREAFPQDRYLHIDSWLDKPCPPDRLLAEVGRVLARRQRRER